MPRSVDIKASERDNSVEMEAVKIMVDNQLAIVLSKTSAHHNRTKHIDTSYHLI